MHGLQACLFRYITVTAFCMEKMPLKGEVGGHALIVMEITLMIMELFLNFCGNPDERWECQKNIHLHKYLKNKNSQLLKIHK